MRISDWSSDVCSSDLLEAIEQGNYGELPSPTYAIGFAKAYARAVDTDEVEIGGLVRTEAGVPRRPTAETLPYEPADPAHLPPAGIAIVGVVLALVLVIGAGRSEEHTSELQSLMRILYAVFCLKKKNILVRSKQTLLSLHSTYY